ncbi:peroxidase 40 isoform X1 [Cucumis sativus]|uniref:peroxidase 40 isoform X1 n=1 Tax=Cucumis sativus TaxID=3659 RepID=UPI0012F5107A|nr:peroxidase 40 isoform X1 [Cucumis sativus]
MAKYLFFHLSLTIFNLSAIALANMQASYGGGDENLPPFGTPPICPEAEAIVFSWVQTVIAEDPRMAASLLRLHFHDCFVNGCDASVLLDDNENFVGEKTAAPNVNSLRGFEVIDAIKSELESVCPQTVSCADILALAARDSVGLSGGPFWKVEFGRGDSISASKSAAQNNIPGPNSTVATLVTKFQNLGLSLRDMVALSGKFFFLFPLIFSFWLIVSRICEGGHTLGKARCTSFSSRLQTNGGSPNEGANQEFIESLKQLCSAPGSSSTLAQLDIVTPATFDNQYYINLLSGEGLLQSDHVLVTGDYQTREIVETYAVDPVAFFEDFKQSMVKMGSLKPPAGTQTVIRTNCRTVS